MRIPRLLIILGPATVLYILAARASFETATSPEWFVALSALALALAPLALLGMRPSRSGASRLAVMGVSLGIAVASARTVSPLLGLAHDVAWLVVTLIMLDLVLAPATRPSVRYGVLGAFSLGAIASATLSNAGLLPASTFGVVVVAGIFATGALHQILLVGRGHAVEGVLSGVAMVSLAVGLAYAWFGPFRGNLAAAVELTVAALLWLGHLAWVDPRWRSLRRVGVPFVGASVVCFAATYAFVPSSSLERWELGVLALSSGALWWLTFSVARRLSSRAVWSTSGRLADGAREARLGLAGGAALDDMAPGLLGPLAAAFGSENGLPELCTMQPPLRVRLEIGERPDIRAADAPVAVMRALFTADPREIFDYFTLAPRAVREPAVRELVDLMQSRAVGCILPCVHLDHIEGALLLPLGARKEPLSGIELQELGRLGDALGGALSSALAQRRAESHIHQLSVLRRDAERRIAALEGEVSQLRGQCDVLGRGLAEDQTLHVAYSPSMRRVQTRAIELAPSGEPVWLIAPAGSPLLPVARFIHDRGPRWEAPFVVADCSAALPDQVMSLLFGSDDDLQAGWFHSATGGTLLLRNLPALPKPAQARLAAALAARDQRVDGDEEARPVPPRILATSRAPLDELQHRGAVDSDLAARIGPCTLVIPPLRERREDVPSLALLAIDRACRVLACKPVGIEQAAMGALVDHDWPGDVAELELILELAVARASGRTITRSDLPPLAWPSEEQSESLTGTYLEVECRLLERALRRSGGNKSEAARMLGLKRTTFLDKLRRHGLEQRPSQDVGGSAVG